MKDEREEIPMLALSIASDLDRLHRKTNALHIIELLDKWLAERVSESYYIVDNKEI